MKLGVYEYRTRLTGLAADEAEAIGVLLSRPTDKLAALEFANALPGDAKFAE